MLANACKRLHSVVSNLVWVMSQGYDLSSFGSFGFPNVNDSIRFDKSQRYPSYSQRSSPSSGGFFWQKLSRKHPKYLRTLTVSAPSAVQSPNFKTGLQNRRVIPEGHSQQLVTLRPSTKMRETKMLQSTVSGWSTVIWYLVAGLCHEHMAWGDVRMYVGWELRHHATFSNDSSFSISSHSLHQSCWDKISPPLRCTFWNPINDSNQSFISTGPDLVFSKMKSPAEFHLALNTTRSPMEWTWTGKRLGPFW